MPEPLQRRAEWIWRERAGAPLRGDGPWGRPDFAQDRNLYVYFRRTFDLAAAPSEALAHVSADGRYRLFVNGAYVGRGPARCDPLWQYYDSYDIAPLLRPGRNVVAALVHSYGQDTSWYQLPSAEWSRAFGCGGFFFQCEVALPGASGRPGGSRLALHSDESWRHALAKAWERDLPGGGPGFPESFDARREPIGWREPNFDDAGWRPTVVLRRPGLNRGPDIRPFPRLVPRDIPFLLEEERFPEAVVAVTETLEAPPNANPAEQLSAEGLEPLAACRVTDAEALLSAGPAGAMVQTAPGRAAVLVIDFGRVVSGYPRLRLEGPAGAAVDLAYGERLVDGRVPIQRAGPVGSQNADRYVLREGPQEWERFEWAGFRYLQLTVRNPERPLRIQTASVNFTSYPVQRRPPPSGFQCSDDLLNRLWEAGAYTLQLCMHDGYEDCPSREQRQWVGDAYVEMLVDFAAFGDPRLAAKLLRQVAQSQRADGMTQMATPGDAAARWGLFITDYCLSWVIALGEYARYSGDTPLAQELFPAVARALAWFEPHLDRHGLLNDVPGWIFIDWAEVDRRGQCTALNALYYAALQHAAVLARLAGAPALARHYRATGRAVRNALNSRLWDEGRGVYVDACVEGVQSRRVSQQANAACIALGLAPRARWPSILAYVLDESRLKATSTGFGDSGTAARFDEERDVVLAQPFFMHHLHRALAAAGRHRDLLDNLRRRWGAMLEAGSSTFWEHWHGEASQCHAWSATPTFDLSTEVLGVRPLAPGFARFAVEPHPAGLDWARGAFPSPAGDITVAWEQAEGSFRLEVEVPSGCRARAAIPPPARGRWTSVAANGTPVWADGAARSNRLGIAAAGARRSLRLEAPAGRYVLEARQQPAGRRTP